MRNRWDKYFPVGLAIAALLSFTVKVMVFAGRGGDGLVPVPRLNYTNTYPEKGFNITCTRRGSRADFKADGSDVAVGDRLVTDCRVVATR